MNYLFESLGDERFQQLCQALLVAVHPDIQCLPVGQPDGGRDSFKRSSMKSKTDEFAVYQVKYSRNPSAKDERDAIEQAIKTEAGKVALLIERGATSYYFLTNVGGTSHLDVGSIDKVNRQLTEGLGIPSYCWWRDDLERRIDSTPEIKWSFPEILRAVDLLPNLLEMQRDPESERRGTAIRSYMAHQAQHDAQLKFKQIDLNKNIIELFVDVPAKMLAAPGHDERAHNAFWSQLIHSTGIEVLDGDDRSERAVGALRLLVNENFAAKSKRLVIEGAPGQGKSTITQYLCQVHRLYFLNRQTDFKRVATEHRPRTAKIPFRVDLRDYASWLAGRDPFSEDQNAKLPSGSTPVLESFIAAQINRQSAMSFSIDDLSTVVRTSQVLIVLDGFDEVAEIKLRNKIVAEVSDASVRLAENAISAQIIVTSRPAAFANSPGFSRDDWQHLQILPLTPSVIELYAARWLNGREADARERRAVLSVLEEKLAHPHVRDLARNPMQLAILLALISVQGASLPDKRTALYDAYINIFLNRESEKSSVVRDHRELLIQIHRFLAWVLHSEAESSGAGNINESRLKQILREYLEVNCHPTDLVEQLFTGMVERVVALVSRVQGTFEFEVQPLREYFAARHLYDTAPYKPATTTNRAGKPERFDAIAKNFYWLNVTRFYAGCYSSGELSSLIDGMDEIGRSDKFSLIGYPAQLGLILLNDHVFSNYPRQASKLVEKITSELNLYVHISEDRYTRDAGVLRFPSNSGSKIVEYAKELIVSGAPQDVVQAGAMIFSENSMFESTLSLWKEIKDKFKDQDKWLNLGMYLGIFRRISVPEAIELINELGEGAHLRFISVERVDVLTLVSGHWELLIKNVLAGEFYAMPFIQPREDSPRLGQLASMLTCLFWPFLLEQAKRGNFKKVPLRKVLGDIFFGEGVALDSSVELVDIDGWKYSDVFRAVDEVLGLPVHTLQEDQKYWSDMLEACRRTWGDSATIFDAAVNYAEFASSTEITACNLFDVSVTLCERASYAKFQATGDEWWAHQLDNIERFRGDLRHFFLLCVVRWMPVKLIFKWSELLAGEIERENLPRWFGFSNELRPQRLKKGDSSNVTVRKGDLPETLSPRLASFVLGRLSSKASKVLVWKTFLKDYDGGDESVWHSVSFLAVEEAYADKKHWPDALAIVKRAYGHGVVDHSFDRHRHHGPRGGKGIMPREIAIEVCSSPRNYPIGLVGAASAVLTAEAGASADVIAGVAARDGWFADI